MRTRHTSNWLAAMAAIAVVAAHPAAAGNESRYQAFPVSDDQFEVIAEFSENAIYWCGAAEYALKSLSKSTSQRIYVVQGPSGSSALPGETAVRFGFRPPASAGEVATFTNDVAIVGNSMSLTQARQGCTERSASG